MHESFFGLQKRPFLAVPTLDRYCPVASQETAFQSCARAITRGDGPVAVLGGTGLGKSMLCLRIGDYFRRNFEVILLASSQICSRRALLQNLLFELSMPYRDLNEGELRLSLLDRLQPSHENPSDGLVLIVDEAQTLSMKLLEELRLITNLTRDGVPRVRLVLCGTLRLEEMLGHPRLESLNQRLACRCYLAPLTQLETLAYLTHKIELCGASIQSTFTDDSMRLIHRATDGVPRLIDQLADQALRLAAESHQRPVSAAVVEAAWASLQQIPLPWSDVGTPIEHHESSIEFGALADEVENDFGNDESTADVTALLSEASRAKEPEIRDSQAAEDLSLERPITSTIPSAGMGLSRVAPSGNQSTPVSSEPNTLSDAWDAFAKPSDRRYDSEEQLTSASEMSDASEGWDDFANPSHPRYDTEIQLSSSMAEPKIESDAWDDFVNPSDRRFETGAIEEFVEDLLEFSAESLPQPSLPAETMDFEPLAYRSDYEEERTSVEPSTDWIQESISEIESNDQSAVIEEIASQPSVKIDDLFGSDFEDEIDIQADSNLLIEVSPPNPILDQNLAFEFNSISPSCQDESLQPYAELQPYTELLDALSSANLEAMTFDPQASLETIIIDGPPAKASSHDDFEGGLSRQTRSTILSFADLQELQHPLISDDRDLLVIEDDLPSQGSEIVPEVKEPAAIQPYKQLFSKLRG